MDKDNISNYKIDELCDFTYSDDFDLFKSDTLHRLKQKGESMFVDEIVSSNAIENHYLNGEYLESLYLLSLIDYLRTKEHKPVFEKYNAFRKYKLSKKYVSKSTYLLLKMGYMSIDDLYKECIKEFSDKNIFEAEIDNIA